jgi:hypothetical protein
VWTAIKWREEARQIETRDADPAMTLALLDDGQLDLLFADAIRRP